MTPPVDRCADANAAPGPAARYGPRRYEKPAPGGADYFSGARSEQVLLSSTDGDDDEVITTAVSSAPVTGPAGGAEKSPVARSRPWLSADGPAVRYGGPLADSDRELAVLSVRRIPGLPY